MQKLRARRWTLGILTLRGCRKSSRGVLVVAIWSEREIAVEANVRSAWCFTVDQPPPAASGHSLTQHNIHQQFTSRLPSCQPPQATSSTQAWTTRNEAACLSHRFVELGLWRSDLLRLSCFILYGSRSPRSGRCFQVCPVRQLYIRGQRRQFPWRHTL